MTCGKGVKTLRWSNRSGWFTRSSGIKTPVFPSNVETVITITLEEHDGKTTMNFRQAFFVTDKDRDGHVRGWNSSFDRLNGLPGRGTDEGGQEWQTVERLEAGLLEMSLTRRMRPRRSLCFGRGRCETSGGVVGAEGIHQSSVRNGPACRRSDPNSHARAEGVVYPMTGRLSRSTGRTGWCL